MGSGQDKLFDEAMRLENLERFEEAIRYYDKILTNNPTDSFTWSRKSFSLYHLDKDDEAVKCAFEAIKLDPTNEIILGTCGLILDGAGRHADAIKCYDKQIGLLPFDATAWTKKGIALTNMNKYGEAFACFDRALEIMPKYVDAMNNKAITLEELDRAEEAKKYYIESSSPFGSGASLAELIYNRSRQRAIQGNTIVALKLLDLAIQREGNLKTLAQKDSKFQNLRDNENFKKLIE